MFEFHWTKSVILKGGGESTDDRADIVPEALVLQVGDNVIDYKPGDIVAFHAIDAFPIQDPNAFGPRILYPLPGWDNRDNPIGLLETPHLLLGPAPEERVDSLAPAPKSSIIT